MEEIRRLQEAFKRAQQDEPRSVRSVHISDRHCVDILAKIRELSLLDFIMTNDGREIVTPTQLVKEVEEEIQSHKGRISTSELQLLLNVDTSFIEVAVQTYLTAETTLGVYYVKGELVTEYVTNFDYGFCFAIEYDGV